MLEWRSDGPDDDDSDDDDRNSKATSLSASSMVTTTTGVSGRATATTTMTRTVSETTTSLSANRFGPSPTLTVSSTVFWTVSAASSSLSQTAIPMRPPKNDGISSTTEHLLIAAGSIGATLALVFVIYLIYRIRKGYALGDVFRSKENRTSYKPYVSRPLGSRWSGGNGFPRDVKDNWETQPSRNPSFRRMPSWPAPAVVRTDSSSSNRSDHPLMSAKQQQPLQNSPATRYEEQTSFLVDDTRSPSETSPQKGAPSAAPSSPVLPIERGSCEFASETMTSHTSIPPYLQNLPNFAPPKISRFSWTNSQAPKTPMETRFSTATSTSSIPRYRTVESWVSVQAGRLDDVRLQEYLQHEREKTVTEPVPELPSMPSMEVLNSFPNPPPPREGTATPVTVTAIAVPMRKPVPILAPIPKAVNVVPTVPEDAPLSPESSHTPIVRTATSTPSTAKQVQSKRRTQGSDATVFRAHPGTRIDIPSSSRIPSEVLDKALMRGGAL